MLMVIFGAGASYDSDPARPQGQDNAARPPLAKDLFNERYRLVGGKHRACLGLFPRLRKASNIEQELERLSEPSEGYDERKAQLLSLRYYLSDVITTSQNGWHQQHQGVTNYVDLLDTLAVWRKLRNE